MKKKLLLPLMALAIVGCTSFVNSSQKSLYVSSQLADGAMKVYAVYWKDQTNKNGATAELLNQQKTVISLAGQVGTGIQVADNAIKTYNGQVGTNTTTKAVVEALVQTAIQNAGALAAFVGSVTGNTNFNNIYKP